MRITFIALGAIAITILSFGIFKKSDGKRVYIDYRRCTVASVKQAPFEEYISTTGRVEPVRTIQMDASAGGKVQNILAEDGQMIQKGDTILQLTNNELRMNYMNQEALLLDQVNNLRNTKINMEQRALELKEQLVRLKHELREQKNAHRINKSLNEKGAISKKDFQTSVEQTNYLNESLDVLQEKIKSHKRLQRIQGKQLESAMELMERNVKLIRENLDDLTVVAPVTGQLSAIRVDYGQQIQTGTNICTIDLIDRYKVQATMDQHYLTQVSPGQKANFSINNHDHILEVKKVYPEVNNGVFQVDLAFPESKPNELQRGQSLRLKVSLSDPSQALILEKGSFYRQTGGKWVYVVDAKSNTAIKRDITIGRQNPHFYEIKSGLQPGDKVIVSDYTSFNNADELIFE